MPINFNSELQLKDLEFAIGPKLIDLLTKLKGFKIVRTLIIELKKITVMQQNNSITQYSNSKDYLTTNENYYLSQSILRLY